MSYEHLRDITLNGSGRSVRFVIETESARFLAYRAMDMQDKRRDSTWQASAAKAFATEMAVRVASKAIEVHGGVGITKEYPVEKLYRDVKIGRIYEGTSNMQLLTIAKKLLGK